MAADGVWVADNEGVETIVTTELLASRYALENGCRVMYWPFGMTRAEAIAADKERRGKLVDKPAPRSAKPSTKVAS